MCVFLHRDNVSLQTVLLSWNLGPMQEFFQEIEEMRGIICQIEADIGRVKQLQNDILTCPKVEQKAKQALDDLMNDIKKKANSGLKNIICTCKLKFLWAWETTDSGLLK